MKNLLLLFVSIASVFVDLKAQAKAEFSTLVVDYGTISVGSDPYRKLTLKNVGTSPLIITSARSSCGCLVPTYTEAPISPGSSVEIKLRYDTERIGVFTKQVTIIANTVENLYILTVKGNVVESPNINNDDPCGKTLIAENTCSFIDDSNSNASLSSTIPTNNLCGASGNIKDVWYQFTAPASGRVTIESSAGSLTDGVMALYAEKSSCTDLTLLECDDDDGVGSMALIQRNDLVPGKKYLIRFWGYNSSEGSFKICVKAEPCICTTNYDPVCGSDGKEYSNSCQAECAGVSWTKCTIPFDEPCGKSLQVNSECNYVTGSNLRATLSSAINTSDLCGAATNMKDVWFEFIAPNSGRVSIKTIAGSLKDGVMALYAKKSSCNELTFIDCDDDDGDGNMPLIEAIDLAKGQTYLIRFWGYDGVEGDFQICIQEEPCYCTAVYNPVCGSDGNTYSNECAAKCAGVTIVPCVSNQDEPCGKTLTIDNDCRFIEASNTNASFSSSISTSNLCGASGSMKDIWFQFVAPPSGRVGIETVAGSLNDGVMALYLKNSSCSDLKFIACDDDGGEGNMPYLEVNSLIAGQTYLIRFWGYNSRVGNFSICVKKLACLCPYNYDPVCGSDGKIYGNSCEAECAGVTWTPGLCGSSNTGCSCTNSFADSFCDDFQKYSLGALGPQSSCWTTWSGIEGTDEDGTVRQETNGTNKYMRVQGLSSNGGPQDVVLQLGNRSSGQYQLKFKMLIYPQDKGYFNIQNAFTPGAGSNNRWAYDVHFDGNGAGRIVVGNAVIASFSYPSSSGGTWFDVVQKFNLNTGLTSLSINGQLVREWTMSEKRLSAIDFYPINTSYRFFVDDINFEKTTGSCICPTVYDPVCGSDGREYNNSCEAECAGVTWTRGKCEEECICVHNYDPVCGSDGKVYGNSCEAECAGVTWTPGLCGSSNTGCSCTNSFADSFCDDFQKYSLGALGPQSSCWTTWSGIEGTDEDGTVRQETNGTNKYMRVQGLSSNGGPQDVVLQLGNRSSGQYQLKFKMLIYPQDKGYFNIQNAFTPGAGSNNRWAYDVHFDGNGAGRVVVGNVVIASFSYPSTSGGIWFDVVQKFNLNTGLTSLSINGQLVREWTMSEKRLSAIDFYPINTSYRFFIDGVEFNKISSGSLHENDSSFTSSALDVRIVPNPLHGNGRVLINAPREELGTLTVSDVSGKIIQQTSLQLYKGAIEMPIDPAIFPSNGIYIATLKTSEKIVAKKFVFIHP